MSLKFDCKNCGKPIIVKYLKAGEVAKCRSCGYENIVPKGLSETSEEPMYSSVVRTGQLGTGRIISGTSSDKSSRLDCNLYDRNDYGGFWRRWSGSFIDGLLLAGIFIIIRTVLGFKSALLAMLFISFGYELILESSRGATLGYELLGMKVISINGEAASLKQTIIRLLSTFFSTLPLGLGFVWVALDKNKQAWHDKIAGTYVIMSDAKPIGRVTLHRKSLIRTKLFTYLTLPFAGLFLISLLGAVIILTTFAPPYKASVKYIKANPQILREVGEIRMLNYARYRGFANGVGIDVDVQGEKGEVTVKTELEKRGGHWIVTHAGYTRKSGEYVEITKAQKADSTSLDFSGE